MIPGIVAGVSIWCTFHILFLTFPEPLSLAAALLVAPCTSGYFAARMGGTAGASVLTIAGAIATLALSVIYIPQISWEYPHQFWAGVPLLVTLLVLGNVIFLLFGSSVGIRVRRQSQLNEGSIKREAVESAGNRILAGKTADMPSYSPTSMAALVMKERDLVNDLAVVKEGKGLEWVSPELVGEKKAVLEKQLLDVILEKERLLRNEGKPPMETMEASLTRKKQGGEIPEAT
jgi:hypothetical protein